MSRRREIIRAAGKPSGNFEFEQCLWTERGELIQVSADDHLW